MYPCGAACDGVPSADGACDADVVEVDMVTVRLAFMTQYVHASCVFLCNLTLCATFQGVLDVLLHLEALLIATCRHECRQYGSLKTWLKQVALPDSVETHNRSHHLRPKP